MCRKLTSIEGLGDLDRPGSFDLWGRHNASSNDILHEGDDITYWLINDAISGAGGHVGESGHANFQFLAEGPPPKLGD